MENYKWYDYAIDIIAGLLCFVMIYVGLGVGVMFGV